MKENRKPTETSALIAIFSLLGALAAACDAGKRESAEPASSQATHVKGDQPAEEPARSALASYESIRASLAKDDIAASTIAAGSLEKSARSAAANANDAAKPHWTKLAEAAKRLQSMPKQDADAVRKAFGEASEPLIALLKADPTLAKGQHVFECPMAQGYGKWVQPNAQLANPYMGSRMLECGSEISL